MTEALVRGNIKGNSEKLPDSNFVTAGDYGCGDEPNSTIDGTVKKNPKLVIALGDLSYNKSAACWLNSFIPLENNSRVKKHSENMTWTEI